MFLAYYYISFSKDLFQGEIMNTIIYRKVIQGKGKGKKLGFPTVNIELRKKIESGVYAGSVKIGGEKYKAGIFVGKDKKILEAHLIGFSGDLYEKKIEVEIQERIREAKKFGSNEELKRQIKKDIELICSRE